VSGVLGLSNAAKMTVHPHANKQACRADHRHADRTGLPAFTRSTFQTFYDVGSDAHRIRHHDCVIAEGNVSEVPTDLQFASPCRAYRTFPSGVPAALSARTRRG